MSTYLLSGSPDSIRSSAQRWNSFGESAAGAHSDLAAVDSGTFLGDEADTYRGKIKNDLAPHLDVAADAWRSIGHALNTYASALEDFQKQMATLKANADDAAAEEKKKAAADPAPSPLPVDPGPNAFEVKAMEIRQQHQAAVDTCVKVINDQKGKRPVDPPGICDKLKGAAKGAWNGLKKGVSWAAKNLAPILDIISMVTGVLALIPCLTPIMGPISLATGAAALGLKLLDHFMNGTPLSMGQIALDTLGLVPGVKSLAGLKSLSKIANAADGTKLAKLGNALKALDNKDLQFAMDHLSTLGALGVTMAMAANGDKSMRDVALAGLGLKVSTNGKFNRVQGLLTSAGGTANASYNLAVKIANGEKVTAKDVALVVTGAAKTGVNARNAHAYSGAGTNPDGSARAAHSNPNYSVTDSKNAIGNQIAGLALAGSLR